jgi:hypothetical protein
MRKENGAIPIRERSNAQVPFSPNTAPSHFSLTVYRVYHILYIQQGKNIGVCCRAHT